MTFGWIVDGWWQEGLGTSEIPCSKAQMLVATEYIFAAMGPSWAASNSTATCLRTGTVVGDFKAEYERRRIGFGLEARREAAAAADALCMMALLFRELVALLPCGIVALLPCGLVALLPCGLTPTPPSVSSRHLAPKLKFGPRISIRLRRGVGPPWGRDLRTVLGSACAVPR